MNALPTLYKQTNTGKIQQWTIRVDGQKVITEFGLSDGKKQTVVDIVREGKNHGKSNQTTPEQQAALQADQEYQAKLKKGYVVEIEKAEAKKNNLGAIEPMLAYDIIKKPKHVVYPSLAQPKLDGQRCIAIIKSGKVNLFSRTQKPIGGHGHIVSELEKLYAGKDIILDGELYSHEYADNFNELMHLAKHGDGKELQYHVYDVVTEGGWLKRSHKILEGQYVKMVRTVSVQDHIDMQALQIEFVSQGYEGLILRNPDGEYEHRRSTSLLKVKDFIDAEFEIVGAEEGSGKLMGAVGAFLLKTEAGVVFGAKPIGSLALSKEYWKKRKELVGKLGTVKFQGFTPPPNEVPRFPSFKAVREE